MRQQIWTAAFIFLYVCSEPLQAQHPVHHHHAAPAPPSNIKSNNQYYDASVDGIEKYLVRIQESNKEAYATLSGDLEALQKKERLKWWVTGGLVGIGSLFIAGAYSFLQHEELDYDGTINKKTNLTAFYSGFGLLSAGILSYMYIGPDREDLLDFINKHNSIPDLPPLQLNLGWNIKADSPLFVSTYSF